ncbi:MAG TPA: ABC transporter permease, partial [Thermoanaerobaculia bacterium]
MNLLSDLRYAVRLLLKAPGFTVVAIVTLALAIGVNVAIFSVVSGFLIRPLPFPEPDRLMQAMRSFPEGHAPSVSLPRFVNWRDHNQVFTHMAAYDTLGAGFNLSGDGPPERLVGSRVTRDFFTVFGIAPEIGRDFLPEEDRPGARKVAILSHDLWQRRFGADRGLVGKQLVMNGESYTVVGIMPVGFRFPARCELWTPVGLDPTTTEKANYLEIAGRLKPGATREQAEAALTLLTKRMAAEHPDMMAPNETAMVVPVQERLYGRLRPALLVLLGAVAFVLLIACVNVANLQLARAAARQREMAIRTVLGASSSRIVRQLLVESLVLALLGGAVGLGLAYLGVPALLALSPIPLERMAPIVIDFRVLLYTLVLSLGAGVLFGLVPATGAARASLAEPLKEGTNRSTGGTKGARTRRILVVSEVALALVLITGAALLVKSFLGIVRTDPGFAPDHVLTVKLSLPEGKYGRGEALEALTRQIVERVSGLPGVQSAAAASTLPLEDGPDLPFAIEGRYNGGKGLDAVGVGEAQYRALTPDLLKTLKIPLVAGRGIEDGDRAGAAPIVLVNEA